ncbi:MAG: DUF6384 family protein [Rhodoplanes sp.]
MTSVAEAPSAPKPDEPKLDDLMLAMDVVDTIRHDERLAERELSMALDDDAIIARLREIYHGQGIDVSDEVLRAGVSALREKRFAYALPKPGLALALARAWVNRRRIGRGLALLLLAGAALAGAYYAAVEQPKQIARTEITEVLPRTLREVYDIALSEAKGESAKARAQELLADGERALAQGDAEETRKAIADLTALRDELRLDYTLRIANRRGEMSAAWRRPRINPLARNYYLIVEATDREGRVIPRPVRNEETGKVETVPISGIRVSQEVYIKVLADKRDDGIIQQNVVGQKKRGFLDIDYWMPVMEGSITHWRLP